MNLLLDSCALIALSNGHLPDTGKKALTSAAKACVSSVSIWEIAIKAKSGKLSLNKTPEKWFTEMLAQYDLLEIPFAANQACATADLPLIHRDPFDRALVATAQLHKLVILTSDQTIPQYPNIKTLW